ncbi:peptidase S8/S53 domain-containing protein, partial [Lactarius vividus]
FALLGVLGVSMLFASGDEGVGGGTTRKTTAPQYTGSDTSPATYFAGTSAGGTMGRPKATPPLSSGGFSNDFKRPVHQTDAVFGFFEQLGNQYSGLYSCARYLTRTDLSLCSASSRGFPDVAAQAIDFVTIVERTQLAANLQVVAGIITLLNDYQLLKNRPLIGFLTPWLYGTANQDVNDITSGSNRGCDTDGFSAVPVWGPVTGVWTPDFQRLLDMLPIPIPSN